MTVKKEKLIVITPTYERPGRMAMLHHLRGILSERNDVAWFVVEDAPEKSPDVAKFLPRFARHFSIGPTRDYGNVQRNLALLAVKKEGLKGVIYMADDDNRYDPELFDEVKKTRKISLVPVGGLGPNGIERPIVVEGKVEGWDSGWAERKFPVDMAGFAFRSELLDDLKGVLWSHTGVGGESEFLERIVSSHEEFEPLCDSCEKVLVWHNGLLNPAGRARALLSGTRKTHKFDLSHLTQSREENVGGPVQDSEALLLYALVKVTLARKIVEVGGLNGYSARNFLKALPNNGTLYTIDINKVPSQGPNHFVITSDAGKVDPAVFGKDVVDLVFFDCHHYRAQMSLLARMEQGGLIGPNTILALHDTNPHPRKFAAWSKCNGKGEWIHQSVEREMVNRLTLMGWHSVCLHTLPERHGPDMPFRHGLTIMRRFQPLDN